MADLRMGLNIRAYDHTSALLLGDVPTPGLQMVMNFKSPLLMAFPEGVDAAEISFNRYVLARGRGDDDLIGLPAFILRGFRHRNFFVRRDSALDRLEMLKGKRLGTNSWSDSGTMWARAAMRDAGVNMDEVQWVAGQFDAKTPTKPTRGGDLQPPASAEHLAEGDTLMAALLEGRIDAITTAFAPDDVFTHNGAVRRLVRNYPEVERAYYQRKGILPAFHIIAVQRSYAEAHPEAVVTLYRALRASWDIWWLKARRFAEASPWAMRDLETMACEFPEATPPFGLSHPAQALMLAAMCEEQSAQGLVAKATDPQSLFSGFLEVLDRLGLDEDKVLPTEHLYRPLPG